MYELERRSNGWTVHLEDSFRPGKYDHVYDAARSRASRAPRNASCHVRAVRVLRVCVVVRVVCAGEGRDTREGSRGKKNQQPFDVLATTTTELKIS